MKRIMKKRISICLSLTLALSLFYTVLPVHLARVVKAADYGLSNPEIGSNGETTWSYIYFGNYWQNDTNGDGKADKNDAKQPIKWRVLSVDGDDAFLLADKNLDCQPYNKGETGVTWETCTLRRWLNAYFYQNAFDSSERSAIQTTTVVNEDNPKHGTKGGNDTSDKVYLLSIGEAGNAAYGFHSTYNKKTKTREAKNTEYAKECGAYTSDEDHSNGRWWLRSPGCNSSSAAGVNSNGYVSDLGYAIDNHISAVRPALHLHLKSSKWSKSGTGSTGVTVTSTITLPAKPTLLKAVNKKGSKVSLSWKKVKGAGGYQVQYSTSKKFKKKKSRLVKKTKYTIKKLRKKKTYYIRIRAYRLDFGKKVYGRWSKVKKIKVKK